MRQPRPLTVLLRWIACCALVLAAAAAAQQPADLYEGEALVRSQGEAERNAALSQALAQVLVKVSGDRAAATDPRLAPALANAAPLARQFRYRQDIDTSSGVPAYRQFLVASFDKDAVDALLGEAGFPVWPQPRPRATLWLVIDDGSGPRLVGAAQAAAARSLVAQAEARGLRVGLPSGDGGLAETGVRAAWQGDPDAAAMLAAESGGPVLLGRLNRGEGNWHAQWTLREGETELARWSEYDADARGVLARGGDRMVDELARRYAEVMSAGPPGSHIVRVRGLRSTADYLRLMGYLHRMPIVRGVAPLAADESGLRVRLELSAGLEGFSRLVANGRTLEAVAASGEDPVFALRP